MKRSGEKRGMSDFFITRHAPSMDALWREITFAHSTCGQTKGRCTIFFAQRWTLHEKGWVDLSSLSHSSYLRCTGSKWFSRWWYGSGFFVVEKFLKTQSPGTLVFAMSIGGCQLIVLENISGSFHLADRIKDVQWVKSRYSMVCFWSACNVYSSLWRYWE